MSTLDLPTIDLSLWLNRKSDDDVEVAALAKEVADCFAKTGVLIVRDPRVSEDDNNRFVDLMEEYYNQPDEIKLADARPHLHYQVGATPEFTEEPRCNFDPTCQKLLDEQPLEHKAHRSTGPDPKWRFFWRIGDRPQSTEFPEMNAEAVFPAAFPQWKEVMDKWGTKMLGAIDEVSRLAALGLGLPRDTFQAKMKNGPHLLAPTGSNLNKFNSVDTIFAGFHTDLNFLTIHGKSRYPGLYIWLRDGRKVTVSVPDGCLLLQAGQQFEYLTGGYIRAGWHEVVVTEATLKAIEKQKALGRPLWRVSSTLFGHLCSDVSMEVLPGLASSTEENTAQYPPIKAGQYVQEELQRIKLAFPDSHPASG